jgi:hypothetical protein
MPPKVIGNDEWGDDMRSGNFVLAMFGAASLAACGFLPPSQQQEFAVSAAPATAAAGLFGTGNPKLNDTLAQEGCVEGYEKLGDHTMPADPGTIDVWRVRCTPHAPWYGLLF